MVRWACLTAILLIFIIIHPAFAQIETSSSTGSVRIENDLFELKPSETITLKISGEIFDPLGGAKLTIIVIDPEGLTTGLQLPITSSGYFETFWTLDDESPLGQYEISASYHSDQIGSVFFTLEEKTFSEEEMLEAREGSSKETQSPSTESQTTKPSLPSSYKISMPEGSSVPGCEITNECYIPHEIAIQIGGIITWSNDDTAAHTVTSGMPSTGPDGFFDSSLMMAGTTFSHTFNESGEFPYFCMVHPWMIGTIIVGNEIIITEKQTEQTSTPKESSEPTTFEKGLSLYQSGNYKDALSQFEIALAEDPTNQEIKNYVQFSQYRIDLEPKCTNRGSPYGEKWFELASECCLLAPPDKIDDCQEGIMWQQIAWERETYGDPMERSLKEQNEKREQERLQAERERNDMMWQQFLQYGPFVGIAAAAAITVGIIKKKSKPKVIIQDKPKEKVDAVHEKEWEGI